MIVQTSGRKNWKVYSIPDSSMKPSADIFARGKMEDSLPLYSLESDLKCQVLIDTTLYPGDVIFCPAGFPHTTSTVYDDETTGNIDIHNSNNDGGDEDETSIHLTLGIDHHIWELDYLSARRLALRRAGVHDTALGQTLDDDNRYVGKANQLPIDIRKDLFAELPLGLLDDNDDISNAKAKEATIKLQQISEAVDVETASRVDPSIWEETIDRFRVEGKELLSIHRDMYLSAIEEGRTRVAEDAMTAHITGPRRVLSPERVQRLSLFRVKKYYEQIETCKNELKQWSYSGSRISLSSNDDTAPLQSLHSPLPENWAYTMPVSVGDQVEADLGGAFFPATVTRVSEGTYDVTFFDGDKDVGLHRSMVRLMNPPKQQQQSDSTSSIDTSNMTPKQLKRWKKEQERLKKSNVI
jgi:Cupin superfamily protein